MRKLHNMSTIFSHKPKNVPKINTKYRVIQTSIPVPESITLLDNLYSIESHAMHGQLPIIWDKADGYQVYDQWGNKWLDFSSTIFVTNAGHGNKRIIKALKYLINKPLLHTYNFTSPERIKYIQYLIRNTPKQFEKAFLLSSGSEATECALKLMRLNGQNLNKRKGGIICIDGNWHGRTMGAQMMSSNPEQKKWIGYLDPNIHHIPFPYPWLPEVKENPKKFFRDSLSHLFLEKGLDPKKDICGIMLETFQGWGAVFYPSDFIKEIELFTKECNAILTFDEMQSGFGRTGTMFGYMHYNVQPDLICCGKGSSSSLPLSIVLGSKKIMDLPEIGTMSSTHSANPLVCAAGMANLEAIINDGLIEKSKSLGEYFHSELEHISTLFPDYRINVQGKGLLASMIFSDLSGKPLIELCNRIAELCMQRGLLIVHTGRESIKLAPPLTIDKEALEEGIDVLKKVIIDTIDEHKVF